MYKIYIKQAWALIRQERFFSSVYIVGTGLAISMVMALAVAYHIRTANIAPEVHRDRMCYLSNVTYKLNGTKSNYKAACGPRLVKEVIGNLHVPEDVAVTTNSFMMPFSFVLVDDDKETIAELLLLDDDTLLVNEELLKGLDEELDAFLKDLLEK